jgi:hypothetical protein
MSKIDLSYINADQLTQVLANCNDLEDLREVLLTWIQSDYSNAQGYIRKYDNKHDKLEGTDIDPLKTQLDRLDKLFKLLESKN